MPDFRFALIVAAPLLSYEAILDATDALGGAGCTDASIRGHAEGMELLFARRAMQAMGALKTGTPFCRRLHRLR